MEKKPRLRAPNFTPGDNILLCDIVSKYKHVIENKKTDGANLLQKQKAWLEVVKEFNSSTIGCSRTVESLQQTYKNLKKKAKKNASDEKMDIPGKRKSEPEKKETVSDKFKLLAVEKLELLELQKELVKTQLQEAQEQAEHNRMLREMEMEDTKIKYIHNEKLRDMEMEEMKRRNEFNEKMRQY